MQSGMGRRDLIAAGLGSLAAASRPSGAIASDIEAELVFACNGGATQHTFEQDFFPGFRALYPGIKITYVPQQPPETLAKLRLQKGAAGIDAAWFAGGNVYTAINEGLLQEIDRSLVPTYAQIPKTVGDEKAAAPAGVTVCGLCTNSDVFRKNDFAPITSWFDMWDPKFHRHCGTYTMSIAACAAMFSLIAKLLTGDPNNFDAAFAKFRDLRPNMLDYFSTAGAWETAMQQGDLWVAMNNGARGQQLRAAGMAVDFTVPKEGGVGYQTWLGIPAGAKHPKAAHAWIAYLLSRPVQDQFAAKLGYLGVLPGAAIPAELRRYYPDLADVFIPDWRHLSAVQPSLVTRWNKEIEG